MKQKEQDRIAQTALKEYNGKFTSIKFFAKETSTVYKLANSESKEFALKIYDEASGNIDDNLIETLLLQKIQEKGSIKVAELIKNKKGKPVTLFKDSSSNKTYRVSLSKWLKGIDFKSNESEERFYKLGQLVAELHLITKQIIVPESLKPKKWDEVFYFRDEKAIYHNPKYKNLVSSEFKELMDTAIPLFNNRLKKIYKAEKPQLLHGDLNPWNVKINDNKLSILDFEDAILGQPVQELAILLFYYKQDKIFSYEYVKKWVLEGYISVRNTPNFSDKDIEFFQMARSVNFLNYVLTLKGDYKKFIEDGLAKLKVFLKSNK